MELYVIGTTELMTQAGEDKLPAARMSQTSLFAESGHPNRNSHRSEFVVTMVNIADELFDWLFD